MKKVIVNWYETHHYESEIEIPDNLSHEEEIDWITLNTDDWGMGWSEPYEIITDWDSFEVWDDSGRFFLKVLDKAKPQR
jgi:hypothetical protein